MHMHSLSSDVYDWVAAHHGTARRRDLLELGVTARQIRHLVHQGLLLVSTRGAFLTTP
jgi:hypothetical protein